MNRAHVFRVCLFAFTVLVCTVAFGQTVPAVPPPPDPVNATAGNFSGNVTVAGSVSAGNLDGGTISGTSLRLTSGPNTINGPTTSGFVISAPAFDGGAGNFSTLNTTGNNTLGGTTSVATLNGDGTATFAGTLSAGVLDGGALNATTGVFSGDVLGAGAATFGSNIASDTGTGNLALSMKAGALLCGDRPTCSATITYDGGTWSIGGKVNISSDVTANNFTLDGGSKVIYGAATVFDQGDGFGGKQGSFGAGANYTGNFNTTGGITADSYLKTSGTLIGTCNSLSERQLKSDSLAGGTSGARTRLCMCTSDGAGTPAYAWVNIVSGTVGTSTACNP